MTDYIISNSKYIAYIRSPQTGSFAITKMSSGIMIFSYQIICYTDTDRIGFRKFWQGQLPDMYKLQYQMGFGVIQRPVRFAYLERYISHYSRYGYIIIMNMGTLEPGIQSRRYHNQTKSTRNMQHVFMGAPIPIPNKLTRVVPKLNFSMIMITRQHLIPLLDCRRTSYSQTYNEHTPLGIAYCRETGHQIEPDGIH